MNELITFKGSNDGLILVITKKANFNQIKEALSKKLASCSNFFEANTTILLKDDKFSQEEQNILADILKQYQLNLKIVSVDKTATNQHCSAQNPPLIIKRTVRGGEEIFSKGSIVIEGNVNPGAKIIAGGNIDIHGHCRGIVYAGAYGDINSYIIADKLSPLQIRIAHLIARAPDNSENITDNKSSTPEKAIICDNTIILEPFNREI